MTRRSIYACDSPGCSAFAGPSGESVLPTGWRAVSGGLHLCPSCRDPEEDRPAPARGAAIQRQAAIILRTVAAHYDLAAESLTGPRRTRHILWPRKIACYLIRTETTLSLPAIGAIMGGRNHTTILVSIRQVEECLSEVAVAEVIAEIKKLYRAEMRRLPN